VVVERGHAPPAPTTMVSVRRALNPVLIGSGIG